MAKYDKKPTYLSPIGVFQYPKLKTPDTKFKSEGEFTCKTKFDPSERETFDDMIGDVIEQAKAEGMKAYKALSVAHRRNKDGSKKEFVFNDPYAPVYDEDTEEPTGEFVLNFKAKASGISKKNGKAWERKITVFDAQNRQLKSVPDMWSGTKGRVAFTAVPYWMAAKCEAGVSLYIEAVQIIELVSGQQRSASSFGFEAVEGGFDANAMSDDEDDDNGNDPEFDEFDGDESGEVDDPAAF